MKTLILSLIAALSFQAQAVETCNRELIQEEMNELRASPYWQQKIQSFTQLMNETHDRDCGFGSSRKEIGIDIFMDDLEFTAFPKGGQVLESHGSYSTSTDSKSDRNRLNIYPVDASFYQPGVVEIVATLVEGRFTLLAKTCSPKVAVAHLVAIAPYALKAKCGSGGQQGPDIAQSIQSEINDILDGE